MKPSSRSSSRNGCHCPVALWKMTTVPESGSVVTVDAETPIEEVVATMEKHQIRRVPVVANGGCCAGIISQADLARTGPEHEVAELVREVSQETGRASH